ncbi:MAG: thiamine pyrophosphate-dependent dehydrogenase E1 component subunit alpha [Planctomycetota bacterium]
MIEPPLSLLNQDGSCSDEARALLADDDLAALVRCMLLNRSLDRRMLMLQRQGRLGFYMTSTGEEATTIGAAYALRPDDAIFLSYREIGSLLWRGITLPEILNQLIGNNQDRCQGRQMPIHFCFRDRRIPSVSSPVGTQLPHAVGYGFAARYQGRSEVALAFLGEGTASEGDFHTALNFAGVLKAPAIFLIRNNGYAISTPENVQTAAANLASRAVGYGLPGVQVDGNDLLAVVQVVSAAAARARRGDGPTLVEALTYRIGAHSTADDPSAYRDAAEAQPWQRFDPLLRLTRHAIWRGIWDEDREKAELAEIEQRINRTIADCEQWPPPAVETMFEDVWASIPPQLAAQREEYLRFLALQNERPFDGGAP